MKRISMIFVALFALSFSTSAVALKCVEMPGGIDEKLPGVDKDMRQFTEDMDKKHQDDRKTLAFCATVIAPLQGPQTAFTTCDCTEAIKRLCKVKWDDGVPKMKGPGVCSVFLPMMI